MGVFDANRNSGSLAYLNLGCADGQRTGIGGLTDLEVAMDFDLHPGTVEAGITGSFQSRLFHGEGIS
jgi:hypothetical protein